MDLVTLNKVSYTSFEISPSKLTSNRDVKWLLVELARLYKPLSKRLSFKGYKVDITPEYSVWWEVLITKSSIKFLLTVPDVEHVKNSIRRQILKTWKQSNVKEVKYEYDFNPETAEATSLSLKHNAILSLDTQNPNYSPLDSVLNAKHYLQDENNFAMLQIGLKPLGNGWNTNAQSIYEDAKKSNYLPAKKRFSKKDIVHKILYGVVLLSEEIVNFIGFMLIPDWKDDNSGSQAMKNKYDIDFVNPSTRAKIKSDAFHTSIRVVSQSKEEENRKSILRSISSGFDPLEGDNLLEENNLNYKKKEKLLNDVKDRTMTVRVNGDVLCSVELSKMINVPDRKAQIEHYNELSLVSHRTEAEVPKSIFEDNGKGIPFCLYENNEGEMDTGYFTGEDRNLLCMPRVVIGEPGTGKTTFAQNFALDAFNRGYGVFMVDAADGKMVQRVLDRIPTNKRDKVKIVDFMNTEYPIGLGWNEIFRNNNQDIVEDLIVEETISYIEVISGTELNMRSRQWVENAIKVVFTTPDATFTDVESMLNNGDYRLDRIEGIQDPELRADWEHFHNMMTSEQQKTIYEEAFRRLSPVMRKRTLKNFILQPPKKDELGNYLFDIRKWMDEGYSVLVKANETLGESLQTALVSFTLSKFNLAMISREDVVKEDDRKPCFLILDEPDHYIKSSEKWRNMLTRYRKYRCGLMFMFHGWQQLKETDRDLPKIIRKAGPHYVIFQTDEDNLKELKPVIEPEFRVSDIAKGIPQHHAVIRLKMYDKNGAVAPAFMAKSVGRTEDRYEEFNNDDLYELCSKELGRPKKEVMDTIFKYKQGADFNSFHIEEVEEKSDKKLLAKKPSLDEEKPLEEIREKMEEELDNYYQNQEEKGEELDEELLKHMEELLEDD